MGAEHGKETQRAGHDYEESQVSLVTEEKRQLLTHMALLMCPVLWEMSHLLTHLIFIANLLTFSR